MWNIFLMPNVKFVLIIANKKYCANCFALMRKECIMFSY